MRRKSIEFGITAGLIVLIIAACSVEERAALRRIIALPTATGTHQGTAASLSETPAFSLLMTSTPPPAVAGPMGTLTAIADLVASPTQDAKPYVIVNRGRPHFIEFHAWW